ncbi:substance-P receptor-like [Ptychodera flava]|uniref:substance-P receptor-like n=1 Tax=Ptychodera flava TaxID=63121 RepID=UPI00396A0ABC
MASNYGNTTDSVPNASVSDSLPRNDNDGDDWEVKLTDPSYYSEQVWVMVVYGFVAVWGTMGNSVVMATILRNKFLRTNTNYFILSLAFADLMACVILFPVKVFPIQYVPPGIGGELLCRVIISEFPMWTSVVSSGFHLGAITIERYIAIIHPYKYVHFTKTKAVVCIICLWSLTLICEPYLIYIYTYKDGHCTTITTEVARRYTQVSAIFLFLLSYVTPIIIMLIGYSSIFKTLKTEERTINSLSGANIEMEREKLKARKNIIKMLLIVVTTYFLCLTPNQILWFSFNAGLTIDFNSAYYNITVMLTFANSCMNPVIYAIRNRRFRIGMKSLFCKGSQVGDAETTLDTGT